MNIQGVVPNFADNINNVKPADKSSSSQLNYTGPSFAQSMKEIAYAANIQVASGNESAALGLRRHKEDKIDELFSFTKAEEDQANEYLARIEKLLQQLQR